MEYLRQGANVAVNHLGGSQEDVLVAAFRRDASKITGSERNRFLTIAGDISQPETGTNFVAETVKAFGRLDVFVSNAGICQFAEFLE